MDTELTARLDAIEKKLDATFIAAEKTRKYIMWMGIITIAVIVLPLFFLPFAIMPLLNTYQSALSI